MYAFYCYSFLFWNYDVTYHSAGLFIMDVFLFFQHFSIFLLFLILFIMYDSILYDVFQVDRSLSSMVSSSTHVMFYKPSRWVTNTGHSQNLGSPLGFYPWPHPPTLFCLTRRSLGKPKSQRLSAWHPSDRWASCTSADFFKHLKPISHVKIIAKLPGFFLGSGRNQAKGSKKLTTNSLKKHPEDPGRHDFFSKMLTSLHREHFDLEWSLNLSTCELLGAICVSLIFLILGGRGLFCRVGLSVFGCFGVCFLVEFCLWQPFLESRLYKIAVHLSKCLTWEQAKTKIKLFERDIMTL